ncbi:hypothetical protein JVT61DRAFT_11273 [Boletus reticuloceps]|uniref:Uncharacterized protein n=1 Tax=Boletus reticuloceps TaxID=495285 RepID=A0A8I2YER3_9AGAM|nr:hypothetical protein JVT61DRAFT_11273 [Boletus reticuloceps]
MQTQGQSPVTQVITEWRLNVSIVINFKALLAQVNLLLDQYNPCKCCTYGIIHKYLIFFKVVFASGASLVLLILAFLLVGIPSKYAHPHSSINGVSVLETLWIALHSRTIREHMADIEEPSLDNLRKAGMFTIRLGDVYASRSLVSESEAFLE